MATPGEWAQMLSGPPLVDRRVAGAVLRRWRGTAAHMPQPRLDQHYLVLHEGGAKRVTRRGHGRTLVADLGPSAVTLVPAGARFDWTTEGPIAFTHLYLPPALLATEAEALTGRDPRLLAVRDPVGLDDAALVGPARRLVALAGAGADALALEEALAALLAQVVARATSAGAPPPVRIRLTKPVLRRVLDRVEAELDGALPLDRLAATAGLSRFHFARAFRAETGLSPGEHVLRRRMARAERLLAETDMGVAEVARACGYRDHSRFSALFRARTGLAPSDWRRG
jgi:AraC family transcriptional regulator